MQAGSLNCPECGAAVSSDATQCAYCHALLQTIACTRCKGMMFAGSKFCPHCGASTSPILIGQPQQATCPRGHGHLVGITLASASLDECPRCGGLWMPISTFDHIVSDSDAQTAATGMVLPPPTPIDPHVLYLKCPQCTSLMSRTLYAHASGVIINTCRQHGVWLDRDQLRHIIEFIRSGGLDRARHIEMEQLDQKRRALEFERRLNATDATRPQRSDDD